MKFTPGNNGAHGFPPGKSGNPGGRSKLEKQIRDWFAEQRVPELDGEGNPAKDAEGNVLFVDGHEAVFRRLFEIILEGEDKHSLVGIREYFDRGFGKPKQQVKITDDTQQPDIDWSKVPVERRRELLLLLGSLGVLEAPTHGDTEH